MSKIMTWCIGLAVVGVLAGGGQSVAAVRAAGSWGRAVEVPGLGALNKGGHAQVFQVSCGSAGSCAAGGYFRDRHGHGQGFVVSERNGRWGRAIEVPGLGALNKGEQAQVLSVSCSPRRNCAAGGFYRDGDGHQQGFVVTEKNGVWGRAIEVPGLAALNAGGTAGVVSVSCASAGNCAAGGGYLGQDGHSHGFVVSERNGHWRQASEVPGLSALATGGGAGVGSVSCASAGNCAAGGGYLDSQIHSQGFVVSEKNGVWGQAVEVPGLGALNKGDAGVGSVSCPSAGNCGAGGNYVDRHRELGFVVSERNGVWGQAIRVPGIRDLGKGNAQLFQVSCASAGNCAAGGFYGSVQGESFYKGFVVSEKNGVWGRAIEVPGLGTLTTGRFARVDSVSCASPGNCAAGGLYEDRNLHNQGFVVSETNGVWGRAIEVPGLAALNKGGNAGVGSVSCASPGTCAAGGSYADRSGRYNRLQGFVT
jgi:hypothetical protein